MSLLASRYHSSRGYFDLVDRFVTPSETLRDKMVKGGFDPVRLVHVPTPVEIARFHPDTRGGADRQRVVYVGQLRPEKGVDVLIRAWGRVRNEASLHGVSLAIAGSGVAAYEGELRRLAVELGGDSIHFLGSISGDRVAQLLGTARATVVPSLWCENVPNALLESFASGTPVIASEVGSLREVVHSGETGYLFQAGDVEALAARLRTVIRGDSHLADMGSRALQHARRHHSPQAHVAALMDVFQTTSQVSVHGRTGLATAPAVTSRVEVAQE